MVGGVELQNPGGAGLVEAHRPVDRARSVASPKLIGCPSTEERCADVADAAAADHRGDVGDGHQLCRPAVGARRARRPDPDADRDLGIGDALQQRDVISSSDTTAPRLVSCRINASRPLDSAALDGLVDGAHDDLVEDPGDLQHVDGRELAMHRPRRVAGTGGSRGEVDPGSTRVRTVTTATDPRTRQRAR